MHLHIPVMAGISGDATSARRKKMLPTSHGATANRYYNTKSWGAARVGEHIDHNTLPTHLMGQLSVEHGPPRWSPALIETKRQHNTNSYLKLTMPGSAWRRQNRGRGSPSFPQRGCAVHPIARHLYRSKESGTLIQLH